MLISSIILLIILSEINQNNLLVVYGGGVISTSFLWSTVNTSLTEKKAPKHCAKIIFFNNNTHGLGDPYIAESQRGIVSNSFIDIEESILHGNYEQWIMAEQKLREATEKSIIEKLDPCVTVVSFVLNSTQYNLTTNIKHSMRHNMVDILQHSTPVKSRHLVIIRISHNLDDFRFCTKAPKYPLRLVPDWEMLLFDFFTDVRVIQGMFHEDGKDTNPYVRISKENGRWKWLCEDIIANLEMERSCNYKLDQKCQEANPKLRIWKPGVKPRIHCEKGFRPRH